MQYKILIVDDEKMMTDLLSDHLCDCGYDTFIANDSREAIALLTCQEWMGLSFAKIYEIMLPVRFYL